MVLESSVKQMPRPQSTQTSEMQQSHYWKLDTAAKVMKRLEGNWSGMLHGNQPHYGGAGGSSVRYVCHRNIRYVYSMSRL